MAQTSPTPVTALPPAPSTTAPSTFSALADAFIAALAGFVTQVNAIATNVYNNAVDAYNNAVAGLASQVAAAASAVAAAASAASAVTSPGTNATSTTSLTIGTGAQAITIQTGKSIVVGMSLKIAYTTSPGNWMLGDVTAYNSGTGALTVNVTTTNGSGTFAAWTVSLSSPVTAAALTSRTVTANYTAVAGDVLKCDTTSGAFAVTLPASPIADDCITFIDPSATWVTNNLTINPNGLKFHAQSANVTCSTSLPITIMYIDATNGWKVIG